MTKHEEKIISDPVFEDEVDDKDASTSSSFPLKSEQAEIKNKVM